MKVSQLLHKSNNNLDLVRIFLASLVVLGHTKPLNGISPGWVDPVDYLLGYTHSAALAVKLFFFISGLVVTNSYLHKKDAVYFINARFFRIIPLLFVVLLLSLFVFGPLLTIVPLKEYLSSSSNYTYLWKNLIFDTQYYLTGVFAHNPYPNAVNGSLWSLKYEMGCYIVVLVSFLLLRKKKPLWLNIPIVFIIVDAFFTRGLMVQYLGSNTEVSLTPLSFALGALLAVNAQYIHINLKTVGASAILLALFWGSQHEHIFLIACAALLMSYISINKHFLKLRPKFDISYGVYLWGFLVQQTLVYHTGHIHAWVHFPLALGITILFGWASFKYVEKPCMALGKKVYGLYQARQKKYGSSKVSA